MQNLRTMYYNTISEKPIDDKMWTNTERVGQRTNYFNRFHGLNKTKEVNNLNLANEFRGLLILDYYEALNNCDTGEHKTINTFDRENLSGTRLRIGKRKSKATKELFPNPYYLTKYILKK